LAGTLIGFFVPLAQGIFPSQLMYENTVEAAMKNIKLLLPELVGCIILP
jgi:hypothetical protein